ncbi:MAG: serine hydrolase [Marinomonas atlantica]|nr:serine hydrolase [Marinomonas atlantica]
MKTIKTFKKVLLVSLLPCALASTQSIAANIVDPLVANVGPESDVPAAVQTLRWHMLDRDVNSLSFRSMDTLFDTRQVARAGDISKLVKSEQPMDLTYEYNGETYSADEFLDRTYTNALLVMKDSKIVYENYLNNMRPDTRHMGWSMTKSITSVLVGIAHEEGRIESLDQPITDYIPELSDSGYAGVTIRQVLEMTSGVDYEERYDFANPGVAAKNHILALVKNVARFADASTSLERKYEPGTVSEYKTIDTAVLGWLLERVLGGTNVASYAAQKLWEPMGAQQNGFFIMDGEPGVGREFTGAGFNATLRDWARFGQMVLNEGEFNGHRIVSADYIKKSTNPVLPEDDKMGGYGYQWWTMPNSNAFSAIGLQGQFVYIDPDTDTVIVKLSYFPQEEMFDLEEETLTFFDKVSNWQTH